MRGMVQAGKRGYMRSDEKSKTPGLKHRDVACMSCSFLIP